MLDQSPCPVSRLLRGTSAAALMASGALFWPGAALAQTAGSGVEQVIVTGSRIGTPGFQTPTPVTEISPLQYEVKQETTIVDLMADIPSLTVNQTQSSSVDVGASNFNLRSLGASRTLVLINGVRTEQTSVNGGFDVNVLPASLVQHIDIVTGGASAAYGSDAVAGVVNVTLNTTLEGLRAKAGYGMSTYGDDDTLTASAAWGTALAGGRAHLVVGGDYFHQLGVEWQSLRPWGSDSWGLIANPGCTTITATCSQLYLSPNVIASQVADGGVITSAGPLKNIAFGPGGVPQPYTVGSLAGATYMIGGSGSRFNQTQSLQPGVIRANLMAHGSYDLSDDVSLWAQMLYSRSTEGYGVIPNYDSAAITITNQNPFIPAQVAAIMTANKITQFVMGRTNTDLGTQDFGRNILRGINEDYSGSAGVKGTLNALGTDWSWDLDGQYFSNSFTTTISQNRITANWTRAVDAVANPATGGVAGVAVGQAVCRSTLTAPTNGCVPADVFGPNTLGDDVRGYVTGTSWVQAQLTMFDTAANIHGEPFATWAGPVSVAFGGEYRRQTTSSQSDAISQASGWRAANAIPFKGAYSVEEGYLELGVPLAKNLPWAVALDIDAAARMTSYSTSGGVTTWKVGFNYSPADEWRLRGTRSHDIRAPSLTELFQTGVLRAGSTVTNPSTGAQSTISTFTTGNPNLLPEIGDTITGGVVYSPDWLAGFNISADYWNIRLSGALATASAQQVVNNCFAGQTSYCPAISFNPTSGLISQVASTQFNAALLKTDGWDFEAGYQFDAGALASGWNGTVQLRALATYVNRLITSQFGVVTDQAGCVGQCANPHLRYNLNAIYLNDPWTVSLTGNWLGGGAYNQLYNGHYTSAQGGMTINNNKVDGRFYVNLSASYQASEAWQLYTRINNVLNVTPPVVPDTTIAQHTVGNSAIYERIGMTWLVGVKLSLD